MKRKAFSLILTVFLIVLIIFSGQTNAFNMLISTSKASYYRDSKIEIEAEIETAQDELAPITQAIIKIKGTDPSNQLFESNCTLSNLNEGMHGECSLQDNRFVQVEINKDDYGYGYGYGYGLNGKVRVSILWDSYDWPAGNYTAELIVKANGNEYSTSALFNLKEKLGVIAFICRTDDCNYGKEQSIIKFLNENGWDVVGKGYWSWSDEIQNYKLIVCADELKACKIDGAHPAYAAHKAGVPFLEIADEPFANAAWRLGYTTTYMGLRSNEELFVTASHQ